VRSVRQGIVAWFAAGIYFMLFLIYLRYLFIFIEFIFLSDKLK